MPLALTDKPAGVAMNSPVTASTRRITPAKLAELLLLAAGLALILLAALADRSWLDRHILPHMFLSRDEQLLWWRVERWSAIALGVLLIWPMRPWIGRRVRVGGGRELAVQSLLTGLAMVASLAASERLLGTASWRKVDRWAETEEPLRTASPYLGWVNAPNRTGWEQFGGRRILYHFDGSGERIGDPANPIDPHRPSILLTGESVMLGFRLNWKETVAGRIAAATGLQSANQAVNGYATDQSYMRLTQLLPRFERPVAVVSLFAPTLMERNLDDDRPHLDATLRWHAARPSWRLERVLKNVALYHSTAAIDAGIATTRSVLAETVSQARARGAVPLILVPSFTPEQPSERAIRERVLAGLPAIRVRLDPRWRLHGDGHPDARANRAMADAVLAALAHQRPQIWRHSPATTQTR
jgi:hypothetical protein